MLFKSDVSTTRFCFQKEKRKSIEENKYDPFELKNLLKKLDLNFIFTTGYKFCIKGFIGVKFKRITELIRRDG